MSNSDRGSPIPLDRDDLPGPLELIRRKAEMLQRVSTIPTGIQIGIQTGIQTRIPIRIQDTILWGITVGMAGLAGSGLLMDTAQAQDQVHPQAASPSIEIHLAQAKPALEGKTLDGDALLHQYNTTLQDLPPLPNLQFRQQVQMSGSQEFTATLDVLLRQDGSWQAWLAQGDRIRLLDSDDLELVDQADLLELYSVYVTEPDALIPQVDFDLSAPEDRYRVIEANLEQLNNSSVHHLVLEPLSDGPLRELWLDPETHLPQRSLLFLSGVWGEAYALIEFAAVEDYWLPQTTRINLGYGFWTLQGLSRRVLRGSLSIEHQYQSYQILPEGTQLRFSPSQPPVDQPPTVAGIPTTGTTIRAGDVQALGPNAEGVEEFVIGLRNQRDDTTILGDQISAFNLTRPATRNALTEFDTLALLPLGSDTLPIYLFQFDAERPLSPLQPGRNPAGSNDPNEVFEVRPPSIQLF